MAETTKESGGLSEFIDNMKNTFSELKDFFENVVNSLELKINELFGKEIFEVTTKTQKELNNLADDILKLNNLNDKIINENEKKIIDKLIGNEKIKNFFVRLNDNSVGEELLNSEKENLLQIVKNLSNNDNDNKKSDLTEEEMNNVISTYESKLKILNDVLSDDNIKNKEPKVTKKQVLEIYNKLLADKKATKENIITEINKSSESSQSNESSQTSKSSES